MDLKVESSGVKILRAGTTNLANWSGQVSCPGCGLVASVDWMDVSAKDPSMPINHGHYFVSCPTPDCQVTLPITPENLPLVVKEEIHRRFRPTVLN